MTVTRARDAMLHILDMTDFYYSCDGQFLESATRLIDRAAEIRASSEPGSIAMLNDAMRLGQIRMFVAYLRQSRGDLGPVVAKAFEEAMVGS